MKRKKKLTLTVLCAALLACLLVLSACKRTDGDDDTKQNIKKMGTELFGQFNNLTDEEIDGLIEAGRLSSQGDGIILSSAAQSWKDLKTGLGELVSVGKPKVELSGGEYRLRLKAVYENRSIEFTFGQSVDGNYLTDMSFIKLETMGEKMSQAGYNLLLGMVTVFLVLIFICFIISGFKYINRLEEKMKKKRGGHGEFVPLKAPPSGRKEEEEDLSADPELVAVIAAAIAASTDASPSGLIVRSIRRAPSLNWKKYN